MASKVTIEKIEDKEEIYHTLLEMSDSFIPSLVSGISDLDYYATRLSVNAEVYQAKKDEVTIGYVAFYANNKNEKIAFITQIAVKKEQQSMGLGRKLITIAEKKSLEIGMESIELEVFLDNPRALEFYKRSWYEYLKSEKENSSIIMSKKLHK